MGGHESDTALYNWNIQVVVMTTNMLIADTQSKSSKRYVDKGPTHTKMTAYDPKTFLSVIQTNDFLFFALYRLSTIIYQHSIYIITILSL